MILSTTAFSAAEWTTYQGNAGHTGYVKMTTNPANYHILWERELASNLNCDFSFKDPVIADGVASFSTREICRDGKPHESLIAFDTKTGEIKWKNDNNNSDVIDLRYVDGKLLTTEYKYSPFRKELNAYDPATGVLLFSTPMAEDSRVIDAYESNLYLLERDKQGQRMVSWNEKTAKQNWVVINDIVNIQDHALSQKSIITSSHAGILVQNRITGEDAYNFKIDDAQIVFTSYQNSVLDDKTNTAFNFYAKDNDLFASLYALDLNKRVVRWVLPYQFPTQHPVIVNNLVFSVDAHVGALFATNLLTGKVEWSWNGGEIDDYTQMVATSDVIFVPEKIKPSLSH